MTRPLNGSEMVRAQVPKPSLLRSLIASRNRYTFGPGIAPPPPSGVPAASGEPDSSPSVMKTLMRLSKTAALGRWATAGSGAAWDWSRAVSPWPGLPLILAGGLTPESVADAVRRVHPWAVDVSSGVERERGRKDLDLVRAFVEAVRRCDLDDGRVSDPSPRGFDALR